MQIFTNVYWALVLYRKVFCQPKLTVGMETLLLFPYLKTEFENAYFLYFSNSTLRDLWKKSIIQMNNCVNFHENKLNWMSDTHWIQLWNNVISSVIRKKSDVTKISKVMWRKRKQTWIFFPKDAKVSMSGNKVRNPIMKPHARPHVVRPLVEAWWGFQNPVCCWVFFFPTRIGKIMRYVPFLAPN